MEEQDDQMPISRIWIGTFQTRLLLLLHYMQSERSSMTKKRRPKCRIMYSFFLRLLFNTSFFWQFHDGRDHASLVRGRQPETLAAMTWIVANPFVLSGLFSYDKGVFFKFLTQNSTGNLHGGSVVASYPFDDHPNANLWQTFYSESL